MSEYLHLLTSSPKLEIKQNPKEVIFILVSCMCDNVSYLHLKQNKEKEFKLSHYNNYVRLAFSNLQTKYTFDEILWEADEGNWDKVIEMINSGTSLIKEVRSRKRIDIKE